jgi:hypothetical protein
VRYRFVIDVGRRADGRRDQRTHTFDRWRQARVERARVISERVAGVLVRPDRQLAGGGFLGQWLESKRGRRPADRTVNYMLTAVTSALRVALRRRLVAVNVGECVERVGCDPDAGPKSRAAGVPCRCPSQ